MPNKLYITKVLPDGYALGVIPEMGMPIDDHDTVTFVYLRDRWKEHLAYLPTFPIHPSLNPKEGEFIEQWREGWEIDDGNFGWFACPEEVYEQALPHYRRKVLFPLVEKKCSTHCDWPNCTLPECIEKRPEGNTPPSEVDWQHAFNGIRRQLQNAEVDLKHHDGKDGINYKTFKGLNEKYLKELEEYLTQSPPSLQEREKEDLKKVIWQFSLGYQGQPKEFADYVVDRCKKILNPESQDTAKQSKK